LYQQHKYLIQHHVQRRQLLPSWLGWRRPSTLKRSWPLQHKNSGYYQDPCSGLSVRDRKTHWGGSVRGARLNWGHTGELTPYQIMKERQMEFDTETDPDTFEELFGEDAASLGDGPVWVYVLERRRAVEVFNSLLGNKDPAVARTEAPNSLRALYGTSRKQNGVMGSENAEIAEIQIASLFASSPIFHTSDLPSDKYGSMRSVSSSIMGALRNGNGNGHGHANGGGSESNPSTVGGSSRRHSTAPSHGKIPWKARALPTTHAAPDIAPRTTKAAALRAGLLPTEDKGLWKTTKPREPLAKERLQSTFANVPGHKRAAPIAVASTAAPAIAPRMTKAAALRSGQAEPALPPGKRPIGSTASPMKQRAASADQEKQKAKETFEGVPGHKRRETFSVASVKAPTVAPRLNKAASMRQAKDAAAPPSSFMFKGPTSQPALSRTNSLSANPSRSSSRQSINPADRPRPSSTTPGSRPPQNISRTSSTGGYPAAPAAKQPAKPRVSVAPPPDIVPRQNRSAMLRAAKMEAEAAGVSKRRSMAF